jgi:DNA-binding NtrC family response regulator
MIEIQAPRLVDRKEDLPLLQRHFIDRFAALYKKEIHGLTRRTQVRLSQHDWPGNVRELENVIGHAAMMAMGNMIDVQDLPGYLRTHSEHGVLDAPLLPLSDNSTLDEQERRLLVQALESAEGNQSKAARCLRIGRDALRYKVKKHNLDSPNSWRGSTAAG